MCSTFFSSFYEFLFISFSFSLLLYRSVTHSSLGEYSKALHDAERAIAVDSYWIKVGLRGKRERSDIANTYLGLVTKSGGT